MSGQGWHMHGNVVMNDHSCIGLHSGRELSTVLVVPVAGARETIARALMMTPLIDRTDGTTEWEQMADAVLAALAAVPPEGEEDDRG